MLSKFIFKLNLNINYLEFNKFEEISINDYVVSVKNYYRFLQICKLADRRNNINKIEKARKITNIYEVKILVCVN